MRARSSGGRPATPGGLALAACLLALVAGGCASSRSVRLADAGRTAGWARVENVSEVRQSSSQDCGAAALAMVLGHFGRDVTPEEIWAASPPPPGHGLRADALRDFARRQGLQAFLVEGQPGDLEREVRRDRPVLVGVVKRRGRHDYRHYEVVVGVNPERQRILTIDPARGARETSLERFTAEWAAAGRLTLVVLPPSPASPAASAAGP